MNLFSVQGGGQNHRILLKTHHFLHEALPDISGLQNGFALFLSCYSRVVPPPRILIYQGSNKTVFCNADFFPLQKFL